MDKEIKREIMNVKSKIVKRATMVCLAVVYMLLACFVMSGCAIIDSILTKRGKDNDSGTHTEEDFKYIIYTKEYNDGTVLKYVLITGLTEVGKTKEVLIFPRQVNGLRVNGFHNPYVLGQWWSIKSDALKKAYLPVGKVENNLFSGCPNLEKIICYEFTDSYSAISWDMRDNPNAKAYIKSMGYDKEKYKDGLYRKETGDLTDIYFANVSYMYNYYTTINDGYYWIDDYDYGSKIEYIPEDPTREGYSFGGWYKEPECINAWDFDTDTLPQVQLDEYGVKYTETRLYAKWAEN